jgi:hypothetical protein
MAGGICGIEIARPIRRSDFAGSPGLGEKKQYEFSGDYLAFAAVAQLGRLAKDFALRGSP